MSDYNVLDDCSLASLDVVSLFTNVPVHEVINLAVDKLYDSSFKKPDISRAQFKQLLSLAVTNVLFDTTVGMYRQVDGVAMGSSLGPMLANLFLALKVDTVLTDRCEVYERYVDDCLLIAKDDEINTILEVSNSLTNLQFTLERGGASLSFLNLQLDIIDGKINISNYSKATDTGLQMNFHSATPIMYKRSVIVGDIRRAYDTSSSFQILVVGKGPYQATANFVR